MYDTYDNIAAGTNVPNISSPTTVAWGYDLTNYVTGPGIVTTDYGTWSIGTDTLNNHYVIATAGQINCGGGGGHYPVLIRNAPGFDICSNITVQGDLQIPTSNTCSGADAHMIMACNPAEGITFKGGISLDSNPGNLFVQFNNDYTGVNWADLSDNTLPFTISTGTWYTMQTQVIFSPAASAVSFYIKLWPKNNPTNVASVTFFDNVTVDPGFIMPTCSGGWRAGWQADETAGTDWYSNLKIFGPGPVVNSTIYDPIPAGVSYVGSSLAPASGPPTLVWNFPATLFSLDTPLNWWGTVSCPGPIVNQGSVSSPSIPVTNSNPVTLVISGVCNTSPTNTPTLTYTPTLTNTPTMTNTGTLPPTNTPTWTPTYTNTFTQTYTPTITNTPTVTFTPTNSFTPTNTPVQLHIWPNPYNPKYAVGGVLKAGIAPSGSTMDLYTVSGESVIHLHEVDGMILWDGRNKYGVKVSGGIYYYIIKNGGSTLLSGKLLIIID
jgi:hypothetical protein